MTAMGKIIRFSLANIKKHKFEAVSLTLLVMMCMLLIGSSLSSSVGIKAIFQNVMEKTGSYENFILILEKNYDKEYLNILKEYPQVDKVDAVEFIYSMNTNYLDEQGKEQALTLGFITADNNARLENSPVETTLSDEEIAALEHPIYMPYTMQDTMGYDIGDTFHMIYGTRRFSFTVAGFYETMLFSTVSDGLKMIVSDADYHILKSILTRYTVIAYNDNWGEGGYELALSFMDECEAYSNCDVKGNMIFYPFKDMEYYIYSSAEMVLNIMIAMAAVIIISVAVMIRYRIAGDIKEQIVNIGVLEALGYTSKEITFSYVLEYLLISAVGVFIGTGGCFLLTPVLLRMGELMTEHRGCGDAAILPIFLTGLGILVFVGLIALIRAGMVRNYPPVRAFRKGQGDHRFGREHFPLRNTKHSVHIRLALKAFVQNFRQNLGLTICITISAVTVVFSFIVFNFFNSGLDAICATAGMEMSDLHIELMPYADAAELAEKLEQMPEVRKATPTSGYNVFVSISDFNNEVMIPMAFSDFAVTENIFPMEGRFPEHDNEIMLTSQFAKVKNVRTGDSLTLEHLNIEKSYIVSGIVTSSVNGGVNLYITEDGMKRLVPTYHHDTIELYLEEGVDTEAFRNVLTAEYGRSLSDASKGGNGTGSYEERIRAEAEQQIADLMATYGVTHIEYSIQSGDTVISGDSSGFLISAITDMKDIIQTQLGGLVVAVRIVTSILMALSAVVVMIILFILMESAIRRDRKEFGIMKGLGYTSKELMFQLACRIVPSAVISVIAGTVIGVTATSLLTSFIGVVRIDMPRVIVLDIVMLIFCFVCAYIGARKIKKISVYELMTE